MHLFLFQEDWSEDKNSEEAGEFSSSYNGGRGGTGGRGRGSLRGVGGSSRGGALAKPCGPLIPPLSDVVVSAPPHKMDGFGRTMMDSEGDGLRSKHGAGAPIGRFDQQLPPRFQKRIEERGRGERGGPRRGGVGLAGSSSRATKEASPDTPDKDWETASENSDPDAMKEALGNKKESYSHPKQGMLVSTPVHGFFEYHILRLNHVGIIF